MSGAGWSTRSRNGRQRAVRAACTPRSTGAVAPGSTPQSWSTRPAAGRYGRARAGRARGTAHPAAAPAGDRRRRSEAWLAARGGCRRSRHPSGCTGAPSRAGVRHGQRQEGEGGDGRGGEGGGDRPRLPQPASQCAAGAARSGRCGVMRASMRSQMSGGGGSGARASAARGASRASQRLDGVAPGSVGVDRRGDAGGGVGVQRAEHVFGGERVAAGGVGGQVELLRRCGRGGGGAHARAFRRVARARRTQVRAAVAGSLRRLVMSAQESPCTKPSTTAARCFGSRLPRRRAGACRLPWRRAHRSRRGRWPRRRLRASSTASRPRARAMSRAAWRTTAREPGVGVGARGVELARALPDRARTLPAARPQRPGGRAEWRRRCRTGAPIACRRRFSARRDRRRQWR